MRTFLLLILVFIVIIILTSAFLGKVVLTSGIPGTARAAAPTQAAATASNQPLVLTNQENPMDTSPIAALIPVTGDSASPYTVQPGDWLSKIAVKCNISLAAILRANPQIIDASLIYPDQLIMIPNANFVPVTCGCANPYTVQSGDWLLKIAAKCDTALAVIDQENPNIVNLDLIYPDQRVFLWTSSADVLLPVTGVDPYIHSGTGLQIKSTNFQPNAPVYVTIGPKDSDNPVVTSGITDASGSMTTQIIIPQASNSPAEWVVIVATTSKPSIRVTSPSFFVINH